MISSVIPLGSYHQHFKLSITQPFAINYQLMSCYFLSVSVCLFNGNICFIITNIIIDLLVGSIVKFSNILSVVTSNTSLVRSVVVTVVVNSLAKVNVVSANEEAVAKDGEDKEVSIEDDGVLANGEVTSAVEVRDTREKVVDSVVLLVVDRMSA